MTAFVAAAVGFVAGYVFAMLAYFMAAHAIKSIAQLQGREIRKAGRDAD